MGVPALFKWLNNKYPKIITSVIEEDQPESIDTPNPNGFEVDNLYLDMNGIIHPCCHPEDEDIPPDEDSMFKAIFAYIDRILYMVRPRRLLYMAVDGVAPRAKMNQQRSRRFRSTQEAQEQKEAAEQLRQTLVENGTDVSETEWTPASDFDSNCITPGTSFMANLSIALHEYISQRINKNINSLLSRVQVIFSDSSVPGEGEHKIMDFIRQQQAASGYPPNLSHVIYGLDADLIMLALATHEPNFRVLREDVFMESRKFNCFRCGSTGHYALDCTSSNEVPKKRHKIDNAKKPFIWLSVSVLREYLYYEFTWNCPRIPSFEGLLDDWIFLIFFVGNDFLPHLPSLSIREGAIDLLVDLYKKHIRTAGPSALPLTNRGNVNVPRVLEVLEELGHLEDKIFAKRKEKEEYMKNRQSQAAARFSISAPPPPPNAVMTKRSRIIENLNMDPIALKHQSFELDKPAKRKHSELEKEGQKEKRAGIANIMETANITQDPEEEPASKTSSVDDASSKINGDDDEAIEEDSNELCLWEAEAKERYYSEKLLISPEDIEAKRNIVKSYLEGLAWVMAYYYKGCVSWTWFYPYHYAPFASDFKLISNELKEITFEKGTPFRPFEQLLGVLPAASSELLPESYASLMKEKESPIIDFYPTKFKIDLNGKRHAWQGVALLPFIDETRLLAASNALSSTQLTEEEIKRNSFGRDLYYVGSEHPSTDCIRKVAPGLLSLSKIPDGIEGKISPVSDFVFFFENPFPDRHLSFIPALLPGTVLPAPTVTINDFKQAKFSKQTLRNTYPLSLLHHHRPHHSMHREYDEKLENNYQKAFDTFEDHTSNNRRYLPKRHEGRDEYHQYQSQSRASSFPKYPPVYANATVPQSQEMRYPYYHSNGEISRNPYQSYDAYEMRANNPYQHPPPQRHSGYAIRYPEYNQRQYDYSQPNYPYPYAPSRQHSPPYPMHSNVSSANPYARYSVNNHPQRSYSYPKYDKGNSAFSSRKPPGSQH